MAAGTSASVCVVIFLMLTSVLHLLAALLVDLCQCHGVLPVTQLSNLRQIVPSQYIIRKVKNHCSMLYVASRDLNSPDSKFSMCSPRLQVVLKDLNSPHPKP